MLRQGGSSGRAATGSQHSSSCTPAASTASSLPPLIHLRLTPLIRYLRPLDRSRAFKQEMAVHVPASLLSLSAVSREMTFSSVSALSSLRLTQSISLHGQLIERWQFSFGFVIPGSTNSWQCIIEKARADSEQQQRMTPETLSGNVLIETTFWDGDDCIGKQRLRVYYDGGE